MSQYAEHFQPNVTPQSEQADPRQVPNSAGGYAFQISDRARLERWLILGSEGGTYYATERELTRENAKTVLSCLAADGPGTVETIAKISESGRAPKNDAAIFALALAAACDQPAVRALAYAALPRVCRTGTHLFSFVAAVDKFRGWGRGLQKAIARWYNGRKPESLAYQVAKYPQRGGWSHADLLRLSHAVPAPEHQAIFRWIAAGGELGPREVKGSEKSGRRARAYGAVEGLPALLGAYAELKQADEQRTIQLIIEHGFTHEMIDTRHKQSRNVWAALLPKMPLGALIRNLGKMTEVGLIAPLSAAANDVAGRLTDTALLKKARVHPVQLLSALRVYAQGHGEKGKLSWTPVPRVVDALDGGFYESFGVLEPVGKNLLLAVDISGSMDGNPVSGIPGLDCRMASAAMAMVTARVEKNWHAVGFSHKLVEIGITPSMRLDQVMKKMQAIPMGGTDCALPMLYAKERKLEVDGFAVYTDNESWTGDIHPHQALAAYRQKSGRPARLAACAFTATEFSVADASDPLQMDLIGLDASMPHVLAEFFRGAPSVAGGNGEAEA